MSNDAEDRVVDAKRGVWNFRASRQEGAKAHAVKNNGVVFASDLGKAKQYYTAPSFDVMHEYVFNKNWGGRDFYEMIEEHLPSKIFYDLDVGKGEDREGLATMVQNAVIQTTIDALRTMFGVIVSEDDVVVLKSDGINKKGAFKASRHIIIPVWMRDVAHVKSFVEQHVQPTLDPAWMDKKSDREAIDTGVYTKNRCFRLLGCHKIGDSRVLTALHEPVVGTPEHRALFIRSLITEPCPEGTAILGVPSLVVVPAKRGRTTTVSQTTNKRRIIEHANATAKESALLRTMEKNLPALRDAENLSFDGVRAINEHRFATWFFKSTECPVKGSPHDSNKGSFRLNLQTMDGWHVCMDPACGGPKWGQMNCRHVVRPNAFKFRSKGVPREWFRPLEAFAKTLTFGKKSVRVKQFTYDPMIGDCGELCVVCNVAPYPCSKHKHEEWNDTTLVLCLGRGSSHTGVWRCSKFCKTSLLKRVRKVRLRLPKPRDW